MTTLNGSRHEFRYRGVDELLARIERIQLRRRVFRAMTGLAGVVAVGAGAMLVVSLCGYWPGQLPAVLRWGFFILLVGTWLGLASWLGMRVLMGRFNQTQAARFIEQALPEVRNDLTNSVLLARDDHQPSPQLVQCAIDECRFRLSQTDLSLSCQPMRKTTRRWIIAAAVTLTVLLAFAVLQPSPFARGMVAVLQPMRYVPAKNFLELVSLTPGDTEKFAGEPLTISLTVGSKNFSLDTEDKKLRAEVVIAGLQNPRPMFATAMPQRTQPGATVPQKKTQPGVFSTVPQKTQIGSKNFEVRLDAVHQPMRYFVRVRSEAGESRWPADKPWFTVGIKKVSIESFTVRYAYPAYTGLADKTAKLSAKEGAIRAPLGSRATVKLQFAATIPAGYIEFRNGRREAMLSRLGGKSYEFSLPIKASGGYRLVFTDQAGRILRQLPSGEDTDKPASLNGYYAITALPDKPPNVSFVEPNRNVTLPNGAELKLKIKASDKFGLTSLQLWAGRKGKKPTRVTGFHPPELISRKEVLATHNWKLAGYAEGDEIIYYAAATDNRNLKSLGGAQTATTSRFRITIGSAAMLQAEQADLLNRLQKRLLAILRQQTRQRVNTEIAQRCRTLRRTKILGSDIRAGQKNILLGLRKVVGLFEANKRPLGREFLEIRRIAVALTVNDAPVAVDQAEVLASLAGLARREKACSLLGDTQDNIIRTLQETLAILPSLARKLNEAAKSPAGSDLTPDLRKAKRQKLSDDIKKFIAEQKKIIEASSRLNKKPVDDFTVEDKMLLHKLTAIEDKWEKFLNETFTDFSKLAEQDFSTPSLLKELLAVKCDVTMARDALGKQAIEIATAAEESSVENAETLTANLEKWLPDSPDRTKWNMEALEDQQNTEQAELFTELEDLVGDLLEEEEDLFEEMDDLTSKSTMSGDKGIGWDAVDGPISNMNAQGVTGNQLPNTSEISGRSGEGRTGKSRGEFVEDKAVGKGGRRTPTRLSDDPFQKGQINDVSSEPPGGATGGGKLSGCGAEGMEGPTPGRLGRELKRLAGKQAAILNRAERISANFKPGDYAAFQMQQAIMLMNRVKNDLNRSQYRNALRRRRATVRALRQTRQILGRQQEIEVSEDSSEAMPKYIRDNISDAMRGKLPAEYRDILQHYYRRLSENRH